MTTNDKINYYENKGIHYIDTIMKAHNRSNYTIEQGKNADGTIDEFCRYDAIITQYDNNGYVTNSTLAENKIRKISYEYYDTLTLSTKKYSNDTHADVYCLWYPASDKVAMITYNTIKDDQESSSPQIKVKNERVLKCQLDPSQGYVMQDNFRIPKSLCKVYNVNLD